MPKKNIFGFLKTVFNPFHATGLFLNPLKTEKFSGGIKRDKWNEKLNDMTIDKYQ